MSHFFQILSACVFLSIASWADRAWSSETPNAVLINGMEFVRIPEGEFWYSVNVAGPGQTPIGKAVSRTLRIWLPEYYIAKYEATAERFVGYLNESGADIRLPRVLDSEGKNCVPEKADDGVYRLAEPYASEKGRPAAALTWSTAFEFSKWMGFRLPTDAEWQKAARGSADQRFWPWGNEFPDDTFGHFSANGECRPVAVDSYSKGQSPYGIFHMADNVTEWVQDWINPEYDRALKNNQRYPGPPAEGVVLPGNQAPQRMKKGGRWTGWAQSGAIPMRPGFNPEATHHANGVRFALDSAAVVRLLADGSATVVR